MLDGAVAAGVVLATDGERRLCGQATPSSKRLFSEAPGLLGRQPLPASTGSRELLPATPPPGQHQSEDGEAPAGEDPQPGEGSAWTRAWQEGTYGGARASVFEYDTPTEAESAARHYLSMKTGDASALITDASVEGAVGLRLLAFAWLGIQTPDTGPYLDVVYVVDGNFEIYVMDADGSGPTRIPGSPQNDEDPVWSPNGKHIAFHSTRVPTVNVFVMNADGSAQTRLSNLGMQNFGPDWSFHRPGALRP